MKPKSQPNHQTSDAVQCTAQVGRSAVLRQQYRQEKPGEKCSGRQWAQSPIPHEANRSRSDWKKNPTMLDNNSTTEEVWKRVRRFIGYYSVSSEGRVRSEERVVRRRHPNGEVFAYTVPQRILSTPPNADGYLTVSLYRHGKHTTWYVHDLVARAFLGVKKPGKQTRHLDDDKGNCRLQNLAYGTRSQNMLDSVRNGTHWLASRSACSNGHPYTDENTIRRPSRPTTRVCKTCCREYRSRQANRQLAGVR